MVPYLSAHLEDIKCIRSNSINEAGMLYTTCSSQLAKDIKLMYQKRLHPLTDQTLCSPPNEQNQSKMQFVCWFQSNALANTCLFVMQLYLILSNPEMWTQFSMI
ncbi:hypothetical protein ACHAXS_002194 [Conticribra weissflogii]